MDMTPERELTALVRPGDTLIIGLNRRLNEEEFGALRDSLATLTDQNVTVGIFEDVTSMVVIRPGDPTLTDEDINDWGEG